MHIMQSSGLPPYLQIVTFTFDLENYISPLLFMGLNKILSIV